MSKTDKNTFEDQELDALFDLMKADEPAPSEGLISAILRDAADQQAMVANRVEDVLTHTPSEGLWARIMSSIGGWPALAGMATATVAGVWIGFAAPTELETLSGGLVLSGDYALAQETYALEDLSPTYLGADNLTEDEG